MEEAPVADPTLAEFVLDEGYRRPWTGVPTDRLAEDLLAFAAVLHAVRPQAVVMDTPLGRGGFALFACSVMDSASQGQVFAVGGAEGRSHRRLRPCRDATEALDRLTKPGPRGTRRPVAAPLVAVVGGDEGSEVLAKMERWAPLVTPGSVLLVEGTAREVLLAGGSGGPWTAIELFFGGAWGQGWAIDRSAEGPISRNPGGWLRRLAEGSG